MSGIGKIVIQYKIQRLQFHIDSFQFPPSSFSLKTTVVMANIGNSYLRLFMEDVISFRGDLQSADYCYDDPEVETVEKQFLELNDCNRLSVNSTPRKSSNLSWDLRSLDDLALVSRRSSLFSQLSSELSYRRLESDDKACKKRSSLPLNTLMLKPLCSKTKDDQNCSVGNQEMCFSCVFSVIKSNHLSSVRTPQYISIDPASGDSQQVNSGSLVRSGSLSSLSCLPTFVKNSVNLAKFPGDTDKLFNNTTVVSTRRNAVPAVTVDTSELFDYDSDSDKMSDVLEDDLERGSAVLAAFVVTLITVTFFGSMVVMISVTMSVSGDYQVCQNEFCIFYNLIQLSPGSCHRLRTL